MADYKGSIKMPAIPVTADTSAAHKKIDELLDRIGTKQTVVIDAEITSSIGRLERLLKTQDKSIDLHVKANRKLLQDSLKDAKIIAKNMQGVLNSGEIAKYDKMKNTLTGFVQAFDGLTVSYRGETLKGINEILSSVTAFRDIKEMSFDATPVKNMSKEIKNLSAPIAKTASNLKDIQKVISGLTKEVDKFHKKLNDSTRHLSGKTSDEAYDLLGGLREKHKKLSKEASIIEGYITKDTQNGFYELNKKIQAISSVFDKKVEEIRKYADKDVFLDVPIKENIEKLEKILYFDKGLSEKQAMKSRPSFDMAKIVNDIVNSTEGYFKLLQDTSQALTDEQKKIKSRFDSLKSGLEYIDFSDNINGTVYYNDVFGLSNALDAYHLNKNAIKWQKKFGKKHIEALDEYFMKINSYLLENMGNVVDFPSVEATIKNRSDKTQNIIKDFLKDFSQNPVIQKNLGKLSGFDFQEIADDYLTNSFGGKDTYAIQYKIFDMAKNGPIQSSFKKLQASFLSTINMKSMVRNMMFEYGQDIIDYKDQYGLDSLQIKLPEELSETEKILKKIVSTSKEQPSLQVQQIQQQQNLTNSVKQTNVELEKSKKIISETLSEYDKLKKAYIDSKPVYTKSTENEFGSGYFKVMLGLNEKNAKHEFKKSLEDSALLFGRDSGAQLTKTLLGQLSKEDYDSALSSYKPNGLYQKGNPFLLKNADMDTYLSIVQDIQEFKSQVNRLYSQKSKGFNKATIKPTDNMLSILENLLNSNEIIDDNQIDLLERILTTTISSEEKLQFMLKRGQFDLSKKRDTRWSQMAKAYQSPGEKIMEPVVIAQRKSLGKVLTDAQISKTEKMIQDFIVNSEKERVAGIPVSREMMDAVRDLIPTIDSIKKTVPNTIESIKRQNEPFDEIASQLSSMSSTKGIDKKEYETTLIDTMKEMSEISLDTRDNYIKYASLQLKSEKLLKAITKELGGLKGLDSRTVSQARGRIWDRIKKLHGFSPLDPKSNYTSLLPQYKKGFGIYSDGAQTLPLNEIAYKILQLTSGDAEKQHYKYIHDTSDERLKALDLIDKKINIIESQYQNIVANRSLPMSEKTEKQQEWLKTKVVKPFLQSLFSILKNFGDVDEEAPDYEKAFFSKENASNILKKIKGINISNGTQYALADFMKILNDSFQAQGKMFLEQINQLRKEYGKYIKEVNPDGRVIRGLPSEIQETIAAKEKELNDKTQESNDFLGKIADIFGLPISQKGKKSLFISEDNKQLNQIVDILTKYDTSKLPEIFGKSFNVSRWLGGSLDYFLESLQQKEQKYLEAQAGDTGAKQIKTNKKEEKKQKEIENIIKVSMSDKAEKDKSLQKQQEEIQATVENTESLQQNIQAIDEQTKANEEQSQVIQEVVSKTAQLNDTAEVISKIISTLMGLKNNFNGQQRLDAINAITDTVKLNKLSAGIDIFIDDLIKDIFYKTKFQEQIDDLKQLENDYELKLQEVEDFDSGKKFGPHRTINSTYVEKSQEFFDAFDSTIKNKTDFRKKSASLIDIAKQLYQGEFSFGTYESLENGKSFKKMMSYADIKGTPIERMREAFLDVFRELKFDYENIIQGIKSEAIEVVDINKTRQNLIKQKDEAFKKYDEAQEILSNKTTEFDNSFKTNSLTNQIGQMLSNNSAQDIISHFEAIAGFFNKDDATLESFVGYLQDYSKNIEQVEMTQQAVQKATNAQTDANLEQAESAKIAAEATEKAADSSKRFIKNFNKTQLKHFDLFNLKKHTDQSKVKEIKDFFWDEYDDQNHMLSMDEARFILRNKKGENIIIYTEGVSVYNGQNSKDYNFEDLSKTKLEQFLKNIVYARYSDGYTDIDSQVGDLFDYQAWEELEYSSSKYLELYDLMIDNLYNSAYTPTELKEEDKNFIKLYERLVNDQQGAFKIIDFLDEVSNKIKEIKNELYDVNAKIKEAGNLQSGMSFDASTDVEKIKQDIKFNELLIKQNEEIAALYERKNQLIKKYKDITKGIEAVSFPEEDKDILVTKITNSEKASLKLDDVDASGYKDYANKLKKKNQTKQQELDSLIEVQKQQETKSQTQTDATKDLSESVEHLSQKTDEAVQVAKHIEPTPTVPKYYDIDESAARLAKDMNSWDSYIEGSATKQYREEIDALVDIIKQKKEEFPKKSDRLDKLFDRYAKNLATYINKGNRIDGSYPSIMIAGPAGMSIRRKEKQNMYRDNNMEFYRKKVAPLKSKIMGYSSDAIMSDDQDALYELEEKVAVLEKEQDKMKKMNAYFRKHKTLKGYEGLGDKAAEDYDREIKNRTFGRNDTVFSSFQLSNNLQEIHRYQQRIKEIKELKSVPGINEQTEEYSIKTLPDEMKIRIFFEHGKPDQEVLDLVKGSGFNYSRKFQTWQRKLTKNAVYSTKGIQKKLHEFYGIPDTPAVSDEMQDEVEISKEIQAKLSQTSQLLSELLSRVGKEKYSEIINDLNEKIGSELNENTVDEYYKDLIKLQEEYIKAEQEIIDKKQEEVQLNNQIKKSSHIDENDVIYHAGTISHLNKAESFWKMSDGARSTGYYGTGHYFVDKAHKKDIMSGNYQELPFTSVDISKYNNLFKANSNKIAADLHYFLKNLNDQVLQRATPLNEEFSMSVEALFSQFTEIFGKEKYTFEQFSEILQQLISHVKNDETLPRDDSIPTKFMKTLGYEGIDTRNTDYADTTFGTVIYNLKKESILQGNITDEIQKQSDMLAQMQQTEEQLFDKEIDAKIQKEIDDEKIRREKAKQVEEIYNKTGVTAHSKEIEDLKKEKEKYEKIINLNREQLSNPGKTLEDFKKLGLDFSEKDKSVLENELINESKKSLKEAEQKLQKINQQIDNLTPVLEKELKKASKQIEDVLYPKQKAQETASQSQKKNKTVKKENEDEEFSRSIHEIADKFYDKYYSDSSSGLNNEINKIAEALNYVFSDNYDISKLSQELQDSFKKIADSSEQLINSLSNFQNEITKKQQYIKDKDVKVQESDLSLLKTLNQSVKHLLKRTKSIATIEKNFEYDLKQELENSEDAKYKENIEMVKKYFKYFEKGDTKKNTVRSNIYGIMQVIEEFFEGKNGLFRDSDYQNAMQFVSSVNPSNVLNQYLEKTRETDLFKVQNNPWNDKKILSKKLNSDFEEIFNALRNYTIKLFDSINEVMPENTGVPSGFYIAHKTVHNEPKTPDKELVKTTEQAKKKEKAQQALDYSVESLTNRFLQNEEYMNLTGQLTDAINDIAKNKGNINDISQDSKNTISYVREHSQEILKNLADTFKEISNVMQEIVNAGHGIDKQRTNILSSASNFIITTESLIKDVLSDQYKMFDTASSVIQEEKKSLNPEYEENMKMAKNYFKYFDAGNNKRKAVKDNIKGIVQIMQEFFEGENGLFSGSDFSSASDFIKSLGADNVLSHFLPKKDWYNDTWTDKDVPLPKLRQDFQTAFNALHDYTKGILDSIGEAMPDNTGRPVMDIAEQKQEQKKEDAIKKQVEDEAKIIEQQVDIENQKTEELKQQEIIEEAIIETVQAEIDLEKEKEKITEEQIDNFKQIKEEQADLSKEVEKTQEIKQQDVQQSKQQIDNIKQQQEEQQKINNIIEKQNEIKQHAVENDYYDELNGNYYEADDKNISQITPETAIKMLNESKKRKNAFFDFSEPITSVDNLDEILHQAFNKANSLQLELAKILTAGDTVKIKLINKELGLVVDQIYRIKAELSDDIMQQVMKEDADETQYSLQFDDQQYKFDFEEAKKLAENKQKEIDKAVSWINSKISTIKKKITSYTYSDKKISKDTALYDFEDLNLPVDIPKTIGGLQDYIIDQLTDNIGSSITDGFKNYVEKMVASFANNIKIAQLEQWSKTEMKPTAIVEAQEILKNNLDTLEAKAKKGNVFSLLQSDFESFRQKITQAATSSDIGTLLDQFRVLTSATTSKKAQLDLQISKFKEYIALQKELNKLLFEQKKEKFIDGVSTADTQQRIDYQRKRIQGIREEAKFSQQQEEEINRINRDSARRSNAYFDGQRVKQQQNTDKNIKEIYSKYMKYLKDFNDLEEKINKYSLKNDGMGVASGIVQGFKSQQADIASKMEMLKYDMMDVLPKDAKFDINSDISQFFEEIRVKAALTTEQIEKFNAEVNRTGTIKSSVQDNFAEQTLSMVSKLSTLEEFLNQGMLSKNSKMASRIPEIFSNFGSIMKNINNTTGATTEDLANLKQFSATYSGIIDTIIETTTRNENYFRNKTAYQSGVNYSELQSEQLKQTNEFLKDKETLQNAANDIAKEMGDTNAIITGFGKNAAGISQLDFSVFDKGTQSLKNFSIELSEINGQMYVTNNTADIMQQAINNAMKGLDSSGKLLDTLKGSNIKIFGEDGEVSPLIQQLQQARSQLNAEISKTDGKDAGVIQKLTKDVSFIQDMVNSAYKKHQQTQFQTQQGMLEGLNKGKFGDSAKIYQQLSDAAESYGKTLGAVSVETGSYNEQTKTLNATLKGAHGTMQQVKFSMDDIDGQITAQKGSIKQLTNSWDQFKGISKGIGRQLATAFFGYNVFFKAISEVRKGIGYVKQIDSAMTELKKVTDATASAYDNFMGKTSGIANKIGTTISNFTLATANFARLGYDINESSDMAKSAVIYKNVADGINSVDEAASSIISTMKAFDIGANDTMTIVDSFNEVGNKFAITSAGIGEAFKRSAAALSTSGNSIHESIGLVTGGNTIVQNPDQVGTALKTLSLRLRGAKVELEEAGLGVDSMAESTSKLRDKLLGLTGGKVDIMLDKNTFKNTTQILREMSKVWDKMPDIDKSAALELMGGKRQANILASIIKNFDVVERAITTSQESYGSAAKENEKWLDSIEGKTTQLNNSMQDMWNQAISSNVVKGFLDISISLTNMVKSVGLLKTGILGVFTYLMLIKKLNLRDIGTGFMSSLAMMNPFGHGKFSPLMGQELNAAISGLRTFGPYDSEMRQQYGSKNNGLFAYADTVKDGNFTAEGYNQFKNQRIQLRNNLIGSGIMIGTVALLSTLDNVLQKTTDINAKYAEFNEGLNTSKSRLKNVTDELDSVNTQIKSINRADMTRQDAEDLRKLNAKKIALESEKKIQEQIVDIKKQQSSDKNLAMINNMLNKTIAGEEEAINKGKKWGAVLGGVLDVALIIGGLALTAGTAGAGAGAGAGAVAKGVAGLSAKALGGFALAGIGIAGSGKKAAGWAGGAIGGAINGFGRDYEKDILTWYKSYEDAISKAEKKAQDSQNKYFKTFSDKDYKKWQTNLDAVNNIKQELTDNLGQMSEYIGNLDYNDSTKDLIDGFNSLSVKLNADSMKGDINSQIGLIQGLEDEFARLSQGVDANGNNVSLTSDAYRRYNEILAQVLATQSGVYKSFNENGQAILVGKDGQIAYNQVLSETIRLLREQKKEQIRNEFNGDDENSKISQLLNNNKNAFTYQDANIDKKLSAYTAIKKAEKSAIQAIDNEILGNVWSTSDAQKIFNDADNTKYLQQILENRDKAEEILRKRLKIESNIPFKPDKYYSQEQIDDFVQVFFGNISRAIKANTETAKNDLKILLSDAPILSDSYFNLSGNSLSFIDNFIGKYVDRLDNVKNLSKEKIKVMQEDITKITDTIGNNTKLQAAIEDAFAIDIHKISYEDYEQEIMKKFSGLQLTDEELNNLGIKYPSELFDYILPESETQAEIKEKIEKIKEHVKEEFQSKLSDFTIDEINLAFQAVNTIGLDDGLEKGAQLSFDQLQKKMAEIEISTIDLENPINNYADSIKNMASSTSVFRDALQKLNQGTFTLLDFIDIVKQFPELANGVDISSNSFNGLADNLLNAMQSSPKELIADLEDLRSKIELAGQSTTSIDQLINAINEMKTDTVKDLAMDFGLMADKIAEANSNSSQLKEAMQGETNTGYKTRVEAFEKTKELLQTGQTGSFSQIWDIAKYLGYTYDKNKEHTENVQGLKDFYNKMSPWFTKNTLGTKSGKDDIYSYDGVVNFIRDVQKKVNETNEETGKTFLEETGSIWNFDGKNFEWKMPKRFWKKLADKMGMQEEMLTDLFVQMGQFLPMITDSTEDQIYEMINADNRLRYLQDKHKVTQGNFTSSNKEVTKEQLAEKGWLELPDDPIYREEVEIGSQKYVLETSVITPDGEIMEPTDVKEYVNQFLQEAEKEGIDAALKFDKNNKNIIIDLFNGTFGDLEEYINRSNIIHKLLSNIELEDGEVLDISKAEISEYFDVQGKALDAKIAEIKQLLGEDHVNIFEDKLKIQSAIESGGFFQQGPENTFYSQEGISFTQDDLTADLHSNSAGENDVVYNKEKLVELLEQYRYTKSEIDQIIQDINNHEGFSVEADPLGIRGLYDGMNKDEFDVIINSMDELGGAFQKVSEESDKYKFNQDTFTETLKNAGYTQTQIEELITAVNKYNKVINVSPGRDVLGLQKTEATIDDIEDSLDKLNILGVGNSITRKISGELKTIQIDLPSLATVLAQNGWSTAQVQQYIASIFGEGNKEVTIGGVKIRLEKVDSEGVDKTIQTAVDNATPPEKKVDVEFSVTGTGNATLDSIATKLTNLNGRVSTANVNVIKTIKTVHVSDGVDSVNGNAHALGTALSGHGYKGGTWGADKSEVALTGELGPELLVRGNTWRTIGDNGAEFNKIQKGDIIFNHEQTKALLTKGYVAGRGRMYTNGTAHANGTAFYVGANGSFGGNYIPNTNNGNNHYNYKGNQRYKNTYDSASRKAAKSAKEFEEVLDWIEIRLKEINEQLDLLDANVENAVGFVNKNEIVDSMIDTTNILMDNLKAGIEKYTSYASGLLAKIPEKYRQAAQDGAISIAEFSGEADEKTVKAIKDYREWVDKASDLTQQVEETKQKLTDLAKMKFENVQQAFENIIDLINSANDKLNSHIELMEESGQVASDEYYKVLIENNKKVLSNYKQQKEELKSILDEQVKIGNIKVGSDAWYEMILAIQELDTKITETQIDIEGFNNKIIEIKWNNFDFLLDKIGSVREEAQRMVDLLEDEELFTKPKNAKFWGENEVQWTKEGTATLGMYIHQIEVGEYESNKYEQAINDLTQGFKNGEYSEIEYTERLKELREKQHDSIMSTKAAKKAIIDLNQRRIEAIKTGIQGEITAYSELISKKKEELSAKQDLYNFEKNVMNQQKSIAELERQLMALSTDNSAAATAKKKQLEAKLADEKTKLEDTYYAESNRRTSEAYDNEQKRFSEAKKQEIEELDRYAEDTKKIIEDSFEFVKGRSQDVLDVLTEKSAIYGLSLSSAVLDPWSKGIGVIKDYDTKFGESESEITKGLEAIDLWWQKIKKDTDAAAKAAIEAQKQQNDANVTTKPDEQKPDSGGGEDNSSANITTGSKVKVKDTEQYFATGHHMASWVPGYEFEVLEDRGDELVIGLNGQVTGIVRRNQIVGGEISANKPGNNGTIVRGQSITVKSSATHFSSKSNGVRMASRIVPGKDFTVMQISGEEVLIGRNGRATGWIYKKDIEGFNHGTTGLKRNQLARVDEHGLEELVLNAGPDGRLQYMSKGTSVLNHDLTQKIMKLAMDPQSVLDKNRPKVELSPSVHNVQVNLDISYGDMLSIKEFNGSNPDEIANIVATQFEKHTRDINNALKKYTR